MKVGDWVEKRGHSQLGMKGLVIRIFDNGTGNEFVDVLREDGEIVTWYKNIVKTIPKE